MTHQEKTDFFNENYEIFNTEIEKRRRKWNLRANLSLDFDDVKQICLRHLYVKIELYDPKKAPLPNWTNSVVSSQISNLLRNNYYNFVRPCVRCSCAIGDTGCELYSEQSRQCVVYKKWEDSKKNAFDIKLALPQDNHLTEIFEIANSTYDISDKIILFHEKMREILRESEFRIYECLFILNLSDEATAKKLGFKPSKTKWRSAGYNSIAKAKKIILIKAKKLIADGGFDLI
jgi:hypothetical protein